MSSTGKSGFTIVEMIVVIVIVAILATMIIPRVSGTAAAAQLRSSAQRLLVMAQYARGYAATRRCACRLVIDCAKGRYGLARQVDPEHQPGKYTSMRGVGKTESLGEGLRFAYVRIESSGPNEPSFGKPTQDDCITFQPMGQMDAAVVQITDGKRTYSMLVAPGDQQIRLVAEVVNELPNNRLDLDE